MTPQEPYKKVGTLYVQYSLAGGGGKIWSEGGGAKNFARASRTGKNDFVPPD